MAPKRKRDDREEHGASSTPSHSSRPSFGEAASPTQSPSILSKRPKFDPNSLRIVWQLADASDSYAHPLAEHETLNDAIYHMNKRLDITTPGDVRLAQVRDTGREVDLCDDFDYQALKDRAMAGRSGGTIVVNVYPGHRASAVLPVQTASPVAPAPYAQDQVRYSTPWRTPPATHTLNRSPASSQPPGSRVDATHPASASRTVMPAPSHSPSSNALSQQQKKKNKKAAKKMREEAVRSANGPFPSAQAVQVPIVQTNQSSARPLPHHGRQAAQSTANSRSSPPVPESASLAARPIGKFEQYKPVKPSPLAQAVRKDSSPTPSVAQPELEDGSVTGSVLGLSEVTPIDAHTGNTELRSSAEHSFDPLIGPAPSLALPSGLSDPTSLAGSANDERLPLISDADANTRPGRSPSPTMATDSPLDLASPFDLTTSPPAAPFHRQRSHRSVTPAVAATVVAPTTSPAVMLGTPSLTAAPITKALPLASSWNLVQKPKGSKGPPSRSSSELGTQRQRRNSKANRPLEPPAGLANHPSSDGLVEPAEETLREALVQGTDLPDSTSTAESSTIDAQALSTEKSAAAPISEPAPAKTPKSRSSKRALVGPASAESAPEAYATVAGKIATPVSATLAGNVIEPVQDAAPETSSAETPTSESKKPAAKRGRPSKVVEMETVSSTGGAIKTPAKRGPKKGAKAAAAAARKAAESEAAAELAATAAGHSVQAESAPAIVDTTAVNAVPAQLVPHTASEGPKDPDRVDDTSVDYFSPGASGGFPTANSTTVSPEAKSRVIARVHSTYEAPESPVSETSSQDANEGVEAFIPGMSPPPGMQEGGPIENAILAGRVACIICQKTPTHLEKDCPFVKAGLNSLRETLEARRTELNSCRARKDIHAKGKTQIILSTLRRSIDTIARWIDRLEDLEQRRNAVRRPASATRPAGASHKANLSATSVSQQKGQAAVRSHTSSPSLDENEPAKPVKQKDASIPPTSESGPHSAGVHMIDLLHQKALRMGRHHPSRAISSSGLSASDALIETGSSGSDTDSDSIQSVASSSDPSSSSSSGSSTASTSPFDGDAGASGASDAEADGEGALEYGDRAAPVPNGIKELSANSEDGDDEGGGSDVEMRSKSSHRTASPTSTSSSVSTSSSPTDSSRSTRSPSPTSPSPIGDPESSFLHFLKKPLSVKERRRARVSAASMPASQDVMDVDDIAMDDKEESEDETRILSSGRLPRRGSDSSIDVGVDDEMDAQSDIVPATQSQPPSVEPDRGSPLLAPGVQAAEEMGDFNSPLPMQAAATPQPAGSLTSPPPSTAPAVPRASVSPVVGGSDGDTALRAAAGDEAVPLASQSPEKPAGHVITQGLPSPVSSQDGQLPATQLMYNTGARVPPAARRRGRPPKLALTASNQSQSSIANSETPLIVPGSSQSSPDRPNSQVEASGPLGSTGGRAANSQRPKNVGFDIAQSQDAPTPKRLTRQSAASQEKHFVQEVVLPPFKVNSSSPLTPIPSATTPAEHTESNVPAVNGDAAGVDNISHAEVEAAGGDSLPNGIMTQRTRSSSAQSDKIGHDPVPPSPRAVTRRSTRSQRSPSLFLSQGSQGLATQKYSTALSSSQSQAHVPSTNGHKAASPIAEDDELEEQNVEEATSPAQDEARLAESDAEDHANFDSDGSATSSEGDDDVPLLRPVIVTRRSASADPTQAKIAVPSLGSLDTAMLRNPNARRFLPATQPTPRSKAMVEESDSDSSSSDDEPTPMARKGRYATGKAKPARKVRASGSVTGW